MPYTTRFRSDGGRHLAAGSIIDESALVLYSASATPGLRGSAAPSQRSPTHSAALAFSPSFPDVTLWPRRSNAGFMLSTQGPSSNIRPSLLKKTSGSAKIGRAHV